MSERSSRWTTLRAGDRGSIVDVPVNAEARYVRVRTPGTEEVRSIDLPMTSLGRPPADLDDEAQLVLAGDRCP